MIEVQFVELVELRRRRSRVGRFLIKMAIFATMFGLGVAGIGSLPASQTAALVVFAAEQSYAVPAEWIFEDEGYSGASLIRPGLERVRDLAAEGQLDAVLVYAPDRLSRRYAYQILLIE